jgi:hypothetical protein
MKNSHLTSLLLERLEHISADSILAHRASGIRGALLKVLDQSEREILAGQNNININELVSSAFEILAKAAKEKVER